MTQSPPQTLPRPSLAFIAAAGPAGLFRPPAQEIFPDTDSWLNHAYAMVPGTRLLRLDIHVPRNAAKPVPAVVFAPGGAWLLVAKNHAPWRALLEAGIAVVSIEYRLSGEAQWPAQLHDAKAAVRYVRAHANAYGIDPERIAGWGCSAGGYIMSMLGATNDRPDFEGDVGENPQEASSVSCVIAHYAPSDPATMGEDTNDIPGIMEPMGTATSPEAKLLGYRPADDPARAATANIANYVSVKSVPFLIMHGDADTRLGIEQSRRLHHALLSAGADPAFHVVEGANHAGPEFEQPAVVQIVTEFLDRHL